MQMEIEPVDEQIVMPSYQTGRLEWAAPRSPHRAESGGRRLKDSLGARQSSEAQSSSMSSGLSSSGASSSGDGSGAGVSGAGSATGAGSTGASAGAASVAAGSFGGGSSPTAQTSDFR